MQRIKFNGEIISKRFNRPQKISITKNGYCLIRFEQKTQLVHRLVALEYLPNPEGKPCIHHKDFNKLNNHVSNLEWCTIGENTRYSAKLDWSKVEAIRNSSFSYSQLAKRYGVTKAHIGHIKHFRLWK